MTKFEVGKTYKSCKKPTREYVCQAVLPGGDPVFFYHDAENSQVWRLKKDLHKYWVEVKKQKLWVYVFDVDGTIKVEVDDGFMPVFAADGEVFRRCATDGEDRHVRVLGGAGRLIARMCLEFEEGEGLEGIG